MLANTAPSRGQPFTGGRASNQNKIYSPSAKPVTRPTQARAGKDEPQAGGAAISEDVLARLRAAEEEATRLRKELAVAQASKLGDTPDVIETKSKVRIDSTDKRETLFTAGERASWLSEKDVDFFTGGGVGETSVAEPADPEAAATVQRRLLIGGALTLALGAFALVPTEALKVKPPKPMYFYIVPLLRIEDLLKESKAIIEDAQWDQLRLVVSRIERTPNNARQNLDNVVALIEDTKTAEKARVLAAELFEYLDSLDYNKYFDAMPTRTLSGVQNAQFVAFSSGALKAAQGKLASFLALLPSESVQTARSQLGVGF